jgi:hypothetical protein
MHLRYSLDEAKKMNIKSRITSISLVFILLTVYLAAATPQVPPDNAKDNLEASIPCYHIQDSSLLEIAPLQKVSSSSNILLPEDSAPVADKMKSRQKMTRAGEKTSSAPLGIHIHTAYEGIHKNTPLLESVIEGIDVDNNPSTGANGKDIQLNFFIFPYPDLVENQWVLWISSFIRVIRLGEEIKYGEFEIYLETTFSLNGQHTIRIGYYSPKNEEIPKEIDEIVTLIPYIFYDEQPEFHIDIAPSFEGDTQSDLSVIVEYSSQRTHRVTINYLPAVDTTMKLTPKIERNQIDFTLERSSSLEQTIGILYQGLLDISFTLEDIPQTMAFTLGLLDSSFEYQASDEFNATLHIEVFDLAFVMRIEYLPRYLKTKFLIEGGHLDIAINRRQTRFIIANDLQEPTKSFSITNLSGESSIRWQIVGKQGYVTIQGFRGLELEIILDQTNYELNVNTILETEFCDIHWDLAIPGFVTLDTNLEWLSSYSFQILFGQTFGIRIQANFLRAEDYQVHWQTSAPLFTRTGILNFIGQITFDIMLNGVWYPVF